jgi:AsmA family protein
MSNPSRNRIVPIARWIGAILVTLVLLISVLGLIEWNGLRGPLSRVASHHLNREVVIGGPLHVHLLSATPSVDIGNLTIANPDWAGGGDMLDLPRLQVAIRLSQLFLGHLVLQSLEIDAPKLSLIRDAQGRANWQFTNQPQKPSKKPSRFPLIRHFALRGGKLNINDAISKLTFDGQIIANEGRTRSDAEPFRLDGQGTLNKEPFKLDFTGDALLDAQLDRPFRFKTRIDAGPSSVGIDGSIDKPFDLGALEAQIDLQGENLANLYYLTGLALPLTPPYRLSVQLHRTGDHFALDNLEGKIGSSDVHGKAAVDLQQDARPRFTATLDSHSLKLGDLGVALGAGVAQQSDATGAPQAPAPSSIENSPLLLPTYEFQFDRLRAMDAAVDFHADSVQTQKAPFKAVTINLKVDHGVLTINPLEFQLPAGKIAGQIRLDSNARKAQVAANIRISDVQLDQFKGKTAARGPLGGVLQARVHLDGRGNSVHGMAADSDGTLSVVVPDGQIREAFAELAGVDIVQGLGLLLTKTQQTSAVRCAVADFKVKDGDAQADRLVVDTQNVLITGDGHITLNDEALDLNLQGRPKQFRLARLRTPINIRGTLHNPSVSLSTPAALKQGSVAAALGLLTPIAAILAFVDPGLAKNADCAALTDEAQDKTAQPAQMTSAARPK